MFKLLSWIRQYSLTCWKSVAVIKTLQPHNKHFVVTASHSTCLSPKFPIPIFTMSKRNLKRKGMQRVTYLNKSLSLKKNYIIIKKKKKKWRAKEKITIPSNKRLNRTHLWSVWREGWACINIWIIRRKGVRALTPRSTSTSCSNLFIWVKDNPTWNGQ